MTAEGLQDCTRLPVLSSVSADTTPPSNLQQEHTYALAGPSSVPTVSSSLSAPPTEEDSVLRRPIIARRAVRHRQGAVTEDNDVDLLQRVHTRNHAGPIPKRGLDLFARRSPVKKPISRKANADLLVGGGPHQNPSSKPGSSANQNVRNAAPDSWERERASGSSGGSSREASLTSLTSMQIHQIDAAARPPVSLSASATSISRSSIQTSILPELPRSAGSSRRPDPAKSGVDGADEGGGGGGGGREEELERVRVALAEERAALAKLLQTKKEELEQKKLKRAKAKALAEAHEASILESEQAVARAASDQERSLIEAQRRQEQAMLQEERALIARLMEEEAEIRQKAERDLQEMQQRAAQRAVLREKGAEAAKLKAAESQNAVAAMQQMILEGRQSMQRRLEEERERMAQKMREEAAALARRVQAEKQRMQEELADAREKQRKKEQEQLAVQSELLEVMNTMKASIMGAGGEAALTVATRASEAVYRNNNLVVPPGEELPEQFSKEEVEEYAVYLGMDLEEDKELLYIAEMAMNAPLPSGWTELVDEDGREFYSNQITGVSTYEHPLDSHFRAYYYSQKQQQETAHAKIHQQRDPLALPGSVSTSTNASKTPKAGHRHQSGRLNNSGASVAPDGPVEAGRPLTHLPDIGNPSRIAGTNPHLAPLRGSNSQSRDASPHLGRSPQSSARDGVSLPALNKGSRASQGSRGGQGSRGVQSGSGGL